MKRFAKASDIRVGLVGYGPSFGMGRHHVGEMTAVGMTAVAVCDTKPECLASAKTNHPGIETYTSLAAMLKKADINTCVVITPHNTHCKLVVQCLNAGKNVIVEKPMAVTTAECDQMIAAAKKNRRLLTVYHNRHWDGFVRSAAQMVKKEHVVGDVVRVEGHLGGYGCPGNWWRASKSISGGILYDMGAHFMEYAFQILDAPMTEVSGFGYSGFWASQSPWGKDLNEDDMNAVVRFKTGQWLLLNSSSIDANPKNNDRGWMEITGTKGTFIMDPGAWRVIQHVDGKKIITSGPNMPGAWNDFYKNLVAHMVKGKDLIITAELGRRVIHVLDLAGQSRKLGRAIKTWY